MNDDEQAETWLTQGGDSGSAPWNKEGGDARFPPTRWTLVQQAAAENTIAGEALEDLCRSYWYPIYAFIRRQGNAAQDAQDLAQGYFEFLLTGKYLARADQEKGKLRSFLLAGVKNFMANQHRREMAQKRGGGVARISIDEEVAEGRYQIEPQADESENPDRAFERRWVKTVMESVLAKLAGEYRDRGKEEQFQALAPFLAWNSGEATYAETGEKLGISEAAVKMAVQRMRKRYRDIFYETILATVSSPEEAEEEISSHVRARMTPDDRQGQMAGRVAKDLLLETERCLLGFPELALAPKVLEAVTDPAYPQNLPWAQETTLDKVESRLGRIQSAWEEGKAYCFAAGRKRDGAHLGLITIAASPEAPNWGLGYMIGPAEWGKGFATECAKRVMTFGFENLGAEKVWAGAAAGNPASIRVLEKLGMRHVQTNPRGYCIDGVWMATEEYEISAQEWRRACAPE